MIINITIIISIVIWQNIFYFTIVSVERFKVIHNCKDIKLTKIKRQIFFSCITVSYKPPKRSLQKKCQILWSIE